MFEGQIHSTMYTMIFLLKGITKWPMTWKSKMLLLFWAVFALITAHGEHINA